MTLLALILFLIFCYITIRVIYSFIVDVIGIVKKKVQTLKNTEI